MNRLFFWVNRSFALSLTKTSNSHKKKRKNRIFVCFYSFLKKIFKKQKILSFLLSQVSESLRLVRTNKRLWAICSGRSEGMSNCERIAQVAHQKWAKRSLLRESLIRSLFLAKTMSQFPTLYTVYCIVLSHPKWKNNPLSESPNKNGKYLCQFFWARYVLYLYGAGYTSISLDLLQSRKTQFLCGDSDYFLDSVLYCTLCSAVSPVKISEQRKSNVK